MFYVSFSFVIALLFLASFTNCSSQDQNREDEHQVIPDQKASDMALHGILLWVSLGFLMPLGILSIRMSCAKAIHQTAYKILFYVHVTMQVVSVVVATIGAALSIRKFENAFNNTHQRIGLALYAAIYLQVLIGLKRPKRHTRGRRGWYVLHWLLGTTTSVLGILNTYTGLQAYHMRTSRKVTFWSIILASQVAFMALLYLLQDKWDYIIRMREMRPNDDSEAMSSNVQNVEDDEKDVDELRKSNALGTHFLKNNALNKLFELT